MQARRAATLISGLWTLSLFACATQEPSEIRLEAEDIRVRLLEEACRSDPDFPDGHDVRLVHFGYVGFLKTSEGRVYVVDRRAVITGMLAPRGLNFITFFDASERYLGKVWYVFARPLWCEGGKLYLFGRLDNGTSGGNVIDMSSGFHQQKVVVESAYGSSGGIEE